MNTSTLMEIAFNLVYLITIYVIVILMFRGRDKAASSAARPFTLAFLLLAVGDTGHVGFRVLAYLNGGLENNSLLVGLGALSTSTTVTGFYVLMLEAWRRRAGADRGPLYWFVITLGVMRLMFMAFPGNQWGNVVPPMGFSYIRNVFLGVMGIVIAALCISSATAANDRLLRRIGILICVSFAFYAPVILFIRSVPALGMLMIPKTLAYVAMAVLGYLAMYRTTSKAVSGGQ